MLPALREVAPPPPIYADVSLIGVVMGPCKADGTQWDGPGAVPPEVFGELALLLGASDPLSYLSGFFASAAVASLEKPDVEGTVKLYVDGSLSDQVSLPKIQDSFTPDWEGYAEWSHLPIDSTRLRLQLIDSDLMYDDPIGTVEINAKDLRAAVDAGDVYYVRVSKQSSKQVLFVAISVLPESEE